MLLNELEVGGADLNNFTSLYVVSITLDSLE